MSQTMKYAASPPMVPANPSTIASSAISFAPVRKAFEIIVQAYQYRKSIRQLRQLDSRMLADIGIDRSEIVSVVYGDSSRRR
ncbi:MAG: DUF1127 domain-containing protein [Hyphomicrobiaceae bacterium]